MPKNIVCKKCNNLVNGWCEKVIDSPDPDMQRDCQYFCEKTNADRIRSMSDDELAKFIDDIAQSVAGGEYCTAFLHVKNFPYSCEDTKKACVAHVVDWLRQPAEVSE